jgi:hypothetical protein
MKTCVLWSNMHQCLCTYKWVPGIGWHILKKGV